MFSDTDMPRMAALSGIALVICFTFVWVAAVAIDGGWVFGVNMISDLGVSSSFAHYVFGWGAIATGILVISTGLAMSSMREDAVGKTPFLLLVLAGAMLMLVGIFNEHTAPHLPSAVALFVAVWISMIILAARDLLRGERLFGSVNAVFALLNLFLFISTPLAFFEAMGVILFMLWALMLSYAVLTGAEGYGEGP